MKDFTNRVLNRVLWLTMVALLAFMALVLAGWILSGLLSLVR